MQRSRMVYSLIIGFMAIGMAATDSVQQVFEEPYPGINMQPDASRYTHHWAATDALGREVVTFDEAGPARNGKVVGVFYYIWLGHHTPGVYDLTRIMSENPDNPQWGPVGHFHFWGEPEMGYYRSDDPWVIRRSLQMLSNADVDFIFFDVTNAFTYLETVKILCEISLQMRKEGIPTPEITFLTNTNSGAIMNQIFEQFYAKGLYEELWFYWAGKPLIMGNFNDPNLLEGARDFFTIRYSWAWTNTTREPNHWQWLDQYPQRWGWSEDPSVPEQITVSVAHHPENPLGTSYHNGKHPPVNAYYLTDYTGQGLQFEEQWKRALEVDPVVIMITQWNEWIAQRFIWDRGYGTYGGRPIKNGDSYFVDALSQEFNRDIAPMKGGHTDNYYYQMVSKIRKFKGMEPPQVYTPPTTMSLDGDQSKWESITPVFRDPSGDVQHRDFAGYDGTTIYTNNTGRNDIVESRVTYDDTYFYFMAKTASPLTAHTDKSWMYLLLDIDRNKTTGWEGYDFVINHDVLSEHQTTLKQWDGTGWVNPVVISYTAKENMIKIEVPRKAIQLTDKIPAFYFKWADNTGSLSCISDFFLYGDVAPDRRFNFSFNKPPHEYP